MTLMTGFNTHLCDPVVFSMVSKVNSEEETCPKCIQYMLMSCKTHPTHTFHQGTTDSKLPTYLFEMHTTS